MAGVQVATPMGTFTVRGRDPQVIGTDARILQDYRGTTALRGLQPYTIAVNGSYFREDFNYTPLDYESADSDEVPGIHREWEKNPSYSSYYLGQWDEINRYVTTTRQVEYGILDNFTSRDHERYQIPVVDHPAQDDRWLRMYGVNLNENVAFRGFSVPAHDPSDGNLDVKVRFRIWPPRKREAAGFYNTLSNRFMLMVHASGTDVARFGYALRDNWNTTPASFEFVRFFGLPGTQEVDIGTMARESTFFDTSFETIWARNSAGDLYQKLERPSAFSRLRNPRVAPKAMRIPGITDKTEPGLVAGDAKAISLVSGDGDYFPGFPRISLGAITGRPITGMAEPDWLWARVQVRSLPNGNVTLKAKIWGGDEYLNEPAAWMLEVVDDTPFSLGGGWTGIARTAPIDPAMGLESGIIPDTGDVDVDSIQVTTVTRPPIGTSVSIIQPQPSVNIFAGLIPMFVIPDGSYVSTDFADTAPGLLPTNWVVPRSEDGPMVERHTFGSVTETVMPGDDQRNFRVVVDPRLDPTKYLSDSSTHSVEHSPFDRTVYFNLDPDAQESEETKILDPWMTRDLLAWTEPYPESDQFGHDGMVGDCEILMKFRVDTITNSISVWLRASGLKGYENGYVLTPVSEGQENTVWFLQKYVNGEPAILASFVVPFVTAEWFRLRVRVKGASDRRVAFRHGQNVYLEPPPETPWTDHESKGGARIQARIWMEDDQEPNFWDCDVYDNGRNVGFEFGGYSGMAQWRNLEIRRVHAASYGPGLGALGGGPRWVGVPDRGWVGFGSASIGTRQYISEFHVHSLEIPHRNFPALDKQNRLPLYTATGIDASRWMARNGNTSIGTTATGEIGGLTTSVQIKANELLPVGQSDHSAALLSHGAFVESVDRVALDGVTRISVLATSHYQGTLQGRNTPGLIDDYDWDQDKGVMVGVRFYDVDGESLGDHFTNTEYGGVLSGPPADQGDFRYEVVDPLPEGTASDGRSITAYGASFTVPEEAAEAAVLLLAGGNTARESFLAQPPKGDQWAIGKVGVFHSDDIARWYDTWPGEWSAPLSEAYVGGTQLEALVPHVGVNTSSEAPLMESTFQMRMPSATTTRPQFTRPVQDVSRGSWTDETGATTGLYDSLDESSPSDADYIQSAHKAVADEFNGRLASVTNPDPDGDSGYFVHYRYRRRGSGTATLTTVLLQGTTEIASWEDSDISKEYVTAKRPLTPEQIAAITDFTDLRFALVGDVTV